MTWYLEVLKKYAVFGGRAQRKEYWIFLLVNILVMVILTVIEAGMGLRDAKSGYGPLSLLYSLAFLCPGIGVTVRRLHDTGHSAWWFLIALVPIVGTVILLVFLARDGQPGENQYGPNPKAEVVPV